MSAPAQTVAPLHPKRKRVLSSSSSSSSSSRDSSSSSSSLAVIWSSGDSPRSIRVAWFELPPLLPNTRIVAIRNNTNTQVQSARPTRAAGAPGAPAAGTAVGGAGGARVADAYLNFYGAQRLQTNRPLVFEPATGAAAEGVGVGVGVNERKFSAGGWVRVHERKPGTLLDARGGPGGFVLGVHSPSYPHAFGISPFVYLGPNASRAADHSANVEPPPGANITAFCGGLVGEAGRAWLYLGFVVDGVAGVATFYAARGDTGDMVREDVRFNPLHENHSLSSAPDNATVGYKNVPSQVRSSLLGLDAAVAGLVVVPGTLTLGQMVALANAQGAQIGTAPLRPEQQQQQEEDKEEEEGGKSGGGGSGDGDGSGDINAGVVDALRGRAVLWLNGTESESTLAHDFPLPLPTRQDVPWVTPMANDTILRLCQSSSASLELPPVTCTPSSAPLLVDLRFKLLHPIDAGTTTNNNPRSGAGDDLWTIATIGDGDAHTRLVGRRAAPSGALQLYLQCFSSHGGPNATTKALMLESVAVALGEWAAIRIHSQAGGVSVNGSDSLHCGCSMGGIWAFLGEGYLFRDYAYATACVEHSVGFLASE